MRPDAETFSENGDAHVVDADVETLTIPAPPAPLTFDELKRLNPDATDEELSRAFMALPEELREQAWTELKLRIALLEWNAEAEASRDVDS